MKKRGIGEKPHLKRKKKHRVSFGFARVHRVEAREGQVYFF